MPPSKYDRELRFIDAETRRLAPLLEQERASMPADPAEAQAKVARIEEMEERVAFLQARKAEILQCYEEAGLTPPYVERSLNATVYRDGTTFMPDKADLEIVDRMLGSASRSTIDELNAEVKDITKEISEVEEKMLQADIDGDDVNTAKLSLALSSLRSRRETLISRIKDLKANPHLLDEAPVRSEQDMHIKNLEEENKNLRKQVDALTSELMEIRNAVRELTASRMG